MLDLRTWIAKRIGWRWRSVMVDNERYVSERIADGLFKERQQLVAKLLKERRRRKDAETRLHQSAAPKGPTP